MAEPITLDQLKNASLDAKTLEAVVNGNTNTIVTSRLGETYPTLAQALQKISEKEIETIGNFEKVAQLPTTATAGALAVVINDATAANGLYRYSGSSWLKTSYVSSVFKPFQSFIWTEPMIEHNGELHVPRRLLVSDNDGNTIVDFVSDEFLKSQLFQNRFVLKQHSSSGNNSSFALYSVDRVSKRITVSNWGVNDWRASGLIPFVIGYNNTWLSMAGEIIKSTPVRNVVDYRDGRFALYYPTMITQSADNSLRGLSIAQEFSSATSDQSAFLRWRATIKKGDRVMASIVIRDPSGAFASQPKIFCYRADSTYFIANLATFDQLTPTARRYSTFFISADDFAGGCAVGAHIRSGRYFLSALQLATNTKNGDVFANDDIGDVAAFDASSMADDAKAFSNSLRAFAPIAIQQPTADYNLFVTYGQSLGRGNETWPSLSKTAKLGNLMLGTASTPLSDTGNATDYVPRGDNNFYPLIAQTVRGGEAKVYTDGDVVTWTLDQATGEPPDVGMLNHAKFLHNARKLEDDTAHKFVTINPSIGGKTIEQLSKVNTHDAYVRYNRIADGVKRAVQAAGGKSLVVPAFIWMQGEYNFYNAGASYDYDSYYTLLSKLRNDAVADIKAQTGQTYDPLFISYQTTGQYVRDVDSKGGEGVHVAQAQLDYTLNNDKAVLAAPTYPYTDKGGHLSNNGSRWIGQQIAKVWHKVAERGERWQPLRPLKITALRNEIIIAFHVPEPPLVFAPVYVRTAATTLPNMGFAVTDGGQTVTISSVTIVDDVCVKITLAQDVSPNAKVWYASQKTSGHGNLRDSDPSLGSDNYEFLASGMSDDQNIAELAGKPYPLQNWCVAFCLPVDYCD